MTTPFVSSATQAQRTLNSSDVYRAVAKAISYGLKVGIPGIIANITDNGNAADIDIAIKDKLNLNNVIEDVQIPRLLDVPLFIYNGGNFAVTMPTAVGDECWIFFADMNINQWFARGAGVNAPVVQESLRRHDYSDAFAIVGGFSKPKQLDSISSNQAQIRTKDGSVFLGIDDTGIVTSGTPVPATFSNISMSLPIKIDGVTYYVKLSTTP